MVVTNKIPTTFNSEQVESSDALDDEPADLDSSIRTADGSTKKKKNKLKVPKEGVLKSFIDSSKLIRIIDTQK